MDMARVERILAAAWRELCLRRGLRVTLVGLALLVFAVYLGGGSALTVPLLIIGGILIAAGLLGPRLSGRLVVEWGPRGTTIDFHTDVASPAHAEAPPAAAMIDRPAAPPQVIEGRGETIEIEVAQLEALMAGARPEGVSRAPGHAADERQRLAGKDAAGAA
jgi:hypothetical protein